MRVPVMRPTLPVAAQVLPYLQSMDERRVYSNFGPLATQLEARYAERLGVHPSQVVSVSSATLGISGAVTLSPCDQWRVPAWTFPASGLAVIAAGKKLVLSDISPTTWTLTPSAWGSAEGVGVLPVMPFGGALNLKIWEGVSEVVVDAAASLGTWPRLTDLALGWAVVFSLHATKVLGAGEGGLVVFGDPERAQAFRSWSNFGFAGSRISDARGTNAKMSEIAAAYALAALDDWQKELNEWQVARSQALEITGKLNLSTGATSLRDVNPYWIVLFASREVRDQVAHNLMLHGIETREWWSIPLPQMPAFQEYANGKEVTFPVAADLAGRSLGLPMYRGMGLKEMRMLEEALSPALGGHDPVANSRAAGTS